MAKGKSVVKGLIDSAESAFFSAIEIHNKPRIAYRYPTATLLMVNAWELLLIMYINTLAEQRFTKAKNIP